MESGRIFCLFVLILSQVSCDENMELMFGQIEDINEEMTDMRNDMSRLENKLMGKISFAKGSLRSELKRHIKQQVREAMAEILQGESIEELVRSQVVSEVRKLKHGHNQMKKQLHQVVKSLRDVQKDKETYRDSLVKAERNATEVLMCSKYVVDSKISERDLEQCNKEISDRNMEIQELIKKMTEMNETCQQQCQKVTTSSGVTTSPTPSTVVTTLPTTRKPEEERSRIIVAPYFSSSRHQFVQLNIHSNTPNSYPYLNLKHVCSLAYVSRQRKLLIGLQSPTKIISSNLDRSGVKTMREGEESYGMAVDEDRELVFMTTHSPRKSISRMTTHGKYFTTVSNLSNYSSPFAIAIDSKEEKIYVTDYSKLFMMTYDGRNVQTLDTGSDMYGLTLDYTAGILYYNNDKILMKISLSNNVISNVTTLSVRPWNLIYHNNTVYISQHGYGSSHIIGAVHVRYDLASYTLQTITKYTGHGLIMCLVP